MGIYFEIIFDIIYLSFAIISGIYLLIKSKRKQYKLFGIMALTLGLGDSFHLIPRIFALIENDFSKYSFYLGYGKLITSITMTIFYLILYYIYIIRYNIKNSKNLSLLIVFLAFIRIILCLLPGNDWYNLNPPVNYGIIRNIPFLIMGIIIILLFYKNSRKYKDNNFKNIYIAIILSFAFYIPVVLFSHIYPIIGILMIPKTIAYAYIVGLALYDFKKHN